MLRVEIAWRCDPVQAGGSGALCCKVRQYHAEVSAAARPGPFTGTSQVESRLCRARHSRYFETGSGLKGTRNARVAPSPCFSKASVTKDRTGS